MFIDSLTIAAIVIFVIAIGMFVKNCFVNSCIREADRKDYKDSAVKAGDK